MLFEPGTTMSQSGGAVSGTISSGGVAAEDMATSVWRTNPKLVVDFRQNLVGLRGGRPVGSATLTSNMSDVRTPDFVIATSSASHTAGLAESLADGARAGDLIVLAGDLGAGKTTFSKGFGLGLGVEATITSPTFTLAREYQGAGLLMHHLDVYRIEQLEEVLDLALPELVESGGVVLVEWGDTITAALQPNYLEIHIEFGEGDDDRLIALHLVGTSWHGRKRSIEQAIAKAQP